MLLDVIDRLVAEFRTRDSEESSFSSISTVLDSQKPGKMMKMMKTMMAVTNQAHVAPLVFIICIIFCKGTSRCHPCVRGVLCYSAIGAERAGGFTHSLVFASAGAAFKEATIFSR